MYTAEKRYIRTTHEIFERRRHSNQYRVIGNSLCQFERIDGSLVVVRTDEIQKYAETLTKAIEIGDYVRLYSRMNVLYRVIDVLDDIIVVDGPMHIKEKSIREVYAVSKKGWIVPFYSKSY